MINKDAQLNTPQEVLSYLQECYYANEKVELVIALSNGTLLRNKSTGNNQAIFVYGFGYGCYGDVVGGQRDSRKYDDYTILKTIETMMEHGEVKFS